MLFSLHRKRLCDSDIGRGSMHSHMYDILAILHQNLNGTRAVGETTMVNPL